MISVLSFVGLAVAFVIAAWARRKFDGIWLKVLFFFAAVIAGNLVYLVLGIAWDLLGIAWGLTSPLPSHAFAREVGLHGFEVLASTVVGALVGLLTSFSDRLLGRVAGI
jgi:hypothetical protein